MPSNPSQAELPKGISTGPGFPLHGLIGKNQKQAEHPAVGELVKYFSDVGSGKGQETKKNK